MHSLSKLLAPQSPSDKRVFAILLLLYIAALVYFFVAPISGIAYFPSDDAYYYLQVARNIAAGNGPTFDGHNLTNGFHPLWLLLILPIYLLSAENPDSSLRVVLGLQATLALLCNWLCWLYVTRTSRQGSAVHNGVISLLLLFCFASPVILMFNGLESAIVLCWIFFLLRVDQVYALLEPKPSIAKAMVLGLLLAGLTLARLDTIYFIIAIAVLKLWSYSPGVSLPQRIRELIASYWPCVATFLALILPYIAWNYTTFGHVSPISGALKSSFPMPNFEFHFDVTSLPYVFFFLVVIALIGFDCMRRNGYLRSTVFPSWRNSGRHMLLGGLLLGCFFHLLWTQLFMSWGVYQWHFIAYVPVLVVCYTFISRVILEQPIFKQWSSSMVIGALALVAVSYTVLLVIEKGNHHHERLVAAEWVQENLPGEEAFLLGDGGAFAYFSGRKTVNLDGLINGYEFQESIAQGRLMQFLENDNVRYLANAFSACDYQQQDIVVQAYKGKNRAAPIGYVFRGETSAEVYAGLPSVHRPVSKGKVICFVIWDLTRLQYSRIGVAHKPPSVAQGPFSF